jgi:hypothetical protein
MTLFNRLQQFESELLSIDAAILRYFKPGLPVAEVKQLFNKTKLQANDDLIELYAWRNGLEYQGVPSGLLSFGASGAFMPLSDSISNYVSFSEELFPLFFPIFWDDMYLINLDQSSVNYGAVFIHSPPSLILEPQKCYHSIASMVNTFSTCFKEKVFRYDGSGFFKEDYEKSTIISRALNPNCEYWN